MLRSLGIFFLSFLISCGKTGDPQIEEEILGLWPRKEQEGFYRTKLSPLNGHSVSGQAWFFLQGIQFYAKVKVQTPWKNVVHLQNLHEGVECPTRKDDLNGDGRIDAVEAMNVAGRVLIPLDEDLHSQLGRFFNYPLSNKKGNYVYVRSASAVRMMRDLRGEIPSHGFFAKIGYNEEIDLNKRVVMVYGVPYDFKLPGSIRNYAMFNSQMSMPIACGKLEETLETFP